jgi:spore photoproduct lyase
VNTKEIVKLEALPNFIVSFSLSPTPMAKRVDLKTPSTLARLKTMEELKNLNFPVAAHFDPIIYEDKLKESYDELLKSLEEKDLTQRLEYLSLGVVRFTKDVYREAEKNYPDSVIHSGPMVKSFDGKVRYHRPMRMWMMNAIKDLAISRGVKEERIYLCMEDNA